MEAEPPYALSDADCKTMCLRYARLEKQVPQLPAQWSTWALTVHSPCFSCFA